MPNKTRRTLEKRESWRNKKGIGRLRQHKSWSLANCGEFENCQIKVSLDVEEGEVEDYYSLLSTAAHP